MKTLTTLALGACMTVALAGASFAQSSMSSMSAADKTQWTKCQGMSPSAMQSDSQCSALLKKHPDLKSGTTGSGMSGSSSSTSGTIPPKTK
jgi:predicted lipoprotein with Yx(FWY)xxD motif